MAMSRRGFLKTVGFAGMVATLDPVSKLWIPTSNTLPPIAEVTLEGRTLQSVVDEQLELNEWARRAAIALADMLERSPAIGLRQVMYEESGNLSTSVLATLAHLSLFTNEGTEEDGELRTFTVAEGRTFVHERGRGGSPEAMAWDLYNNGALGRFSMFAPLSKGLREGEEWGESDRMRVGLATEPESGVSVRVMRWTDDHGPHTGIEVAGGSWQRDARYERITPRRNNRPLLSRQVAEMRTMNGVVRLDRKPDSRLVDYLGRPARIDRDYRVQLDEGDIDITVDLKSSKGDDT